MRLTLVLALALLVLPAGATLADGGPDTPASGSSSTLVAQASCSPPCGEINPRIMFDFPELGDETVPLAQGESATFSGQVVFWADTDDEGYSPRDPQQPILIRFSFPRLPAWAQMSVEPQEIEVPVNTCAQCLQAGADDPSRPTAHWQYAQEIELTVEAVDTPEPTPGYDYGKLQLFAKSSESGIYNPGYGIREVRVQTDADPALEANSTNGTPALGTVAALAAIGGVAVLASLARRR